MAGDVNNGILGFLKYVIMVIKQDNGKKFIVERPAKFGGNVEYSSYAEIEKDFSAKKLHPMDLKNAFASEVNDLLKSFRKNKVKLSKLVKEAYR